MADKVDCIAYKSTGRRHCMALRHEECEGDKCMIYKTKDQMCKQCKRINVIINCDACIITKMDMAKKSKYEWG